MEISVTWVCGQSFAFIRCTKNGTKRPHEFISTLVLIEVLAIIHIHGKHFLLVSIKTFVLSFRGSLF